MVSKKLEEIKKELIINDLDGYIIPSFDEFFSEYTPVYAKRLNYVTGFSGSNGIALITRDNAILFTDGRYILQAEHELCDSLYNIIDISKENISSWIKSNLNNNSKIGFDPKTHSKSEIDKYSNYCKMIKSANLVDEIWIDKPVKKKSRIYDHDIIYSGKNTEEKINYLMNYIESKNLDKLIITSPESICWLLNIRGDDVNYNPIILCYLIISKDRELILFTDSDDPIGDQIKKLDFKYLPDSLQLKNQKIQIDIKSSNYWFIDELTKNDAIIIDDVDPCIIAKSIKNKTEINGSRLAHIKDSIAICNLLYWIYNDSSTKTELSIIEKLEYFRKQQQDYKFPSFATICGFASNASIIHYKADEKSSKTIIGDNLLLIDSGGQYLCGTTDVTRTIAIGDVTQEQKTNFTNVLKGHIALATAVFPTGTYGHQLDSIARYYLWKNGLDYPHSTGHGVGNYLSVHEGPQRISSSVEYTKLSPGMILSNEPGYYKNNDYGIRIENLLLVKNSIFDGFLEFEDLTLVPIDYKLIEFDLLNKEEKEYLKKYHQKILDESIKQNIGKDISNYLKSYIDHYDNIAKS